MMEVLSTGWIPNDYWRTWNIVALTLICWAFSYRTVRDLQKHPWIEWETFAWRCINILILATIAVANGVNISLSTDVYWYVKVGGVLYFFGLLVLVRPWNLPRAWRRLRNMRRPPPSD